MQRTLTSGFTKGDLVAGRFAIVGTEHAARVRLPRHDHEAATIVVVRDGEFEETVGARTFHCVAGTVLIKPAGAHHSNAYGSSGSTAMLAAVPSAYAIPDVRYFENASAMRRLSLEFDHRDSATAIACEAILLELLEGQETKANRSRGPIPNWLRVVEESLRCDYAVSISTIAAEVERDPAHLAREFRRHFGMSPARYARSAKIERACNLLRRSSESIATIALSAGFYDQSHFTNVFRRLVRMTPAEYRRRAHEMSKTRQLGRR